VTGASLAVPVIVALVVAALAAVVARPLTRRRHARLVGGTVADLQKLVGDLRVGDVLPGPRGRRASGRPAAARLSLLVGAAPLPGKRLVDLVGEQHPVSGLGRHRRPLTPPLLTRRVARRPVGYWQAYLEGVELPVRSGAGERFFTGPAGRAAAARSGRPAAEPTNPASHGTTDARPDVAQGASRSEETMDDDATPQSYDAAPDDRHGSLRSELPARVGASSHLSGWWEAKSPQQAPSTWEPAGVTEPSAFWRSTTPEPPRPERRSVAVIDLVPPGPLPSRRPEPEPVAVEPEPVAVEPEPVAVEPEPVAVGPEPVEQAPVGPEPGIEPRAELSTEAATTSAVPQQRGHRAPSPQQRHHLRRTSRRLETTTDRFEIARVACEESLVLVEADIASLVVRSVEGPRVLRQEPQGLGIWGARTLAALMNLGRPLRKVIEGDPLSGGGQTALLVVPVPSGGAVAGTLIVRRTTGRAFSPSEQDCLERLARMAGAGLDAAARRGALIGGHGRVDRVTGLAHRERLVQDLRSSLLTLQTHGMPASLVAAEVTGLAALRERAGRPAADEALAAVAAAVTHTLRVGDVPYRFGVDELAVLLPATSMVDAPAAARRLCDAVDALGVRPGGDEPLRLRTAAVPVVGVAEDVVFRAIRALAAADREPTVDA